MFFKVLDSLGLKPGFQSTQRMQAAHTTVLQCTQKLAILTAPIDIYIVCLKKHNTFLFLFFWSCEAFVSSFCVLSAYVACTIVTQGRFCVHACIEFVACYTFKH